MSRQESPATDLPRSCAVLSEDRCSNPSQQSQDENNDQDGADNARWAVAPGAAVTPARNHAEQHEDQQDDENGAERHERNPRYSAGIAINRTRRANHAALKKFHRQKVRGGGSTGASTQRCSTEL